MGNGDTAVPDSALGPPRVSVVSGLARIGSGVGDPSVEAVRERFPGPVAGIAEARGIR
jgi:hypothetical protein